MSTALKQNEINSIELPIGVVIMGESAPYDDGGKSSLDKNQSDAEYIFEDTVITVRRFFGEEHKIAQLVKELIEVEHSRQNCYNEVNNIAVVPQQKEGR